MRATNSLMELHALSISSMAACTKLIGTGQLWRCQCKLHWQTFCCLLFAHRTRSDLPSKAGLIRLSTCLKLYVPCPLRCGLIGVGIIGAWHAVHHERRIGYEHRPLPEKAICCSSTSYKATPGRTEARNVGSEALHLKDSLASSASTCATSSGSCMAHMVTSDASPARSPLQRPSPADPAIVHAYVGDHQELQQDHVAPPLKVSMILKICCQNQHGTPANVMLCSKTTQNHLNQHPCVGSHCQRAMPSEELKSSCC